MKFQIGMLTVLTLLIIRIACMIYLRFYDSNSVRKLIELSTIDKICRIIQYGSSGIIANNEPYVDNLFKCYNLDKYISIGSLKQLSSTMSLSRKILRFFRGPMTLVSLCKNTRHILNLKEKTTYNQIIEITKCIGDFFDIVFYFTNHFSAFFLIGLVKSKQLQLQLEFIGHVAWILNALFYLCSAMITIYYYNTQRNKSKEKEATYKKGILDLISNWNQFLLGFAFIYPRWLPRELISSMVITSSISRLIKLKFS